MSTHPCTLLITADDVEDNCDIDQYDEENPPSDEDLEDVVAAASRVAWSLGGRRHGVCEIEGERPGRVRRRDRCSQPYRTSGGWVNGCACSPAGEVFLGRTPIVSVDAVVIGSTLLADNDYALIKPNKLVRRDGGSWPACQLLNLPSGAADVLEVDYTAGIALDVQGIMAVSALACEMLKAKRGLRCALPERVTSVTRQGVSFVVIDPMKFLQQGRTGVYRFDLWLRSVNPDALTGGPTVRSPDYAVPRGGTLVPPAT